MIETVSVFAATYEQKHADHQRMRGEHTHDVHENMTHVCTTDRQHAGLAARGACGHVCDVLRVLCDTICVT
jgi:hypothetical protein